MFPLTIKRSEAPDIGMVIRIKGRKYIVSYISREAIILRLLENQSCFCVYRCSDDECEAVDGGC